MIAIGRLLGVLSMLAAPDPSGTVIVPSERILQIIADRDRDMEAAD